VPRKLSCPVFDADNHMYETTDAFTKYLPSSYDGLVKYVEVNGRTKIALRNHISEYIPNPTFSKVAPPGAQEVEFQLKNPHAKKRTPKEGDKPLSAPPKYIESPPAFFNPADRLILMNELGLDRAIMWPTLASLIEERLADAPQATHAVVHALNEWMFEHWTYNYENRIFPTPVITLPVVDEAIREFERVVERGARAILIRPAPVPGPNGRRSFALAEFDPFWKVVEESGVLVGMHASDDGFQRYINDWEGADQEFLPFKKKNSAFHELVHNDYRSIKDTIASIIGHGLATRFPRLRFMPVENGSAWVRPLIENLKQVYAVSPDLFDEDPLVTLKRSVYVHPFHEEDVLGLVDAVGVDNVVFGSDYPHPEGMFDPVTWIDELETLPEADQAAIMGGNLAKLMGVDPTAKVI